MGTQTKCSLKLFLFVFILIFFLFVRFFVDIRLYNKARSVIEPFSFDKYRKEKVRQQIEAARPNRLQIKTNLPKVNQELALKLMDPSAKTKKSTTSLLSDDRFKDLFDNPEFEVDKNAMEYKMLTPVLSRLDKSKIKKLKQQEVKSQIDEDDDGGKSTDEDLFEGEDDNDDDVDDRDASSDDEDERAVVKEMKKQYKQIRKENQRQATVEEDDDKSLDVKSEPKMFELHTNEFKVKNLHRKADK